MLTNAGVPKLAINFNRSTMLAEDDSDRDDCPKKGPVRKYTNGGERNKK
jgi:hypothetical protein